MYFCTRQPQGKMPEWSNGPHSKCGERVTAPWVRIPVSPLNVLDRNGQQTDKKLQINDLWLFFIARKSCFQDFKSTVKDKVSLLNRYLFPAGQKR